MAYRSRQHKNVPHEMAVANLSGSEESNSTRVCETAGHNEEEPGPWKQKGEWFSGQDEEPTHSEIKREGKSGKSRAEHDLENNSKRSASPHDSEQSPAKGPSKYTEGKRRGASRDQQKNRAMIQDAK